ncbi:MAG TPA: SpoVR family protein [Chloroflexota bacterium]|nr:SpoVR family protein [Chloroflexota bacterium]
MSAERDEIRRAIDDLAEVAFRLGLQPPNVRFEIVPVEALYELAAYHFPERFAHWTHGASYHREKTHYDYGLGKIYELVLNTDPCLAYLLDTNSLVENKLVIAHVFGHADFFRRNVYFRETDRHMDQAAARHAQIVDDLEQEHGVAAVESLLDAALAISFQVDPTAVGFREKLAAEYEGERRHPPEPPTSEYDDLWNLNARREIRPIQPRRNPPEPRRDILRFLADNSPVLEEWQRSLLHLVREEFLYFYPNMRTKVMNEGYATFWHERVLEQAGLSPDEHVRFRTLHVGVIASSNRFGINPYGLGYHLWRDVERRWETPEPEATWYGETKRREGGRGLAKVFEVAADYRDAEFVRAFLTEQLVEELDLYVYGFQGNARRERGEWRVNDISWTAVRDALVDELTGLGIPAISVVDADYRGRGELLLVHDVASDRHPLDPTYARRTLTLIHRLWGKPVHLETETEGKKVDLSAEETGDRR